MSTTPAVTKLTDIADDLDAAVTALGDVRGRRDREDVFFVLARIRDTAQRAIESIEKTRKRKTPPNTNAGFDTENDWTAIVVRLE